MCVVRALSMGGNADRSRAQVFLKNVVFSTNVDTDQISLAKVKQG